MKELEAKLKRAQMSYDGTAKGIAELESRRLELYNAIDDIKKQIADSKVTYSRGDRFLWDDEEYILAYTGDDKLPTVGMVNLRTGGTYEARSAVQDECAVTVQEFHQHFGSKFKRTACKQEKC